MILFHKVETFGGICSLLTGVGCASIAARDFRADEGIWKAWVILCLVLLVNGVAMVRHVRPLAALQPEGGATAAGSLPGSIRSEPLPGDAGQK